MKLTSMDRQSLQFTSNRVLAALKTLEEELGVKFSYKGGSYGATGMLKIGVDVQDTGTGKSSGQIHYETCCGIWGMKPEWFGKTFWSRGTEYRLIGTNPGSPKYALSIQRMSDGATYKAPVSMVKSGFESEIAIGRMAA